MAELWDKCLTRLEGEYPAEYNTWLRPLHPIEEKETLTLLAPNRFVVDWVGENFLARITSLLQELCEGEPPIVKLGIGSYRTDNQAAVLSGAALGTDQKQNENTQGKERLPLLKTNLRDKFNFKNFIEGNSNQLALAAALQVVEKPGEAYNPLFIYGGVGLGKTHLMQAIGNAILKKNASFRVLYLHSERFVADMVKALQKKEIDDFKRFYRSVDMLLIDDIQFFSRKERSQEEFFHTFNYLLEGQQQVVLSSDRYPKEIDGVEERLKSRFGWGLTVAVEPPELETRVAILLNKAQENHCINLLQDVAFFVASNIRSNVRELEGALKRVVANAHFTGRAITVDFARESLRDLLAVHDKLITLENIQKTVAGYFKIKIADILSKRRTRSITLPRQIAMTLAKELTSRSLPEIGDAFGGRDHTTVLHACRKIKALLQSDPQLTEDYQNLLRILST